MIELDPGPAGPANAAGAYQNALSYAPGPPSAIPGLGTRAQLNEARTKAGSSAQLHVLRRNAIITVAYVGTDSGAPMTAAEMRNGPVTAARSVVAALR